MPRKCVHGNVGVARQAVVGQTGQAGSKIASVGFTPTKYFYVKVIWGSVYKV